MNSENTFLPQLVYTNIYSPGMYEPICSWAPLTLIRQPANVKENSEFKLSLRLSNV